MRTFNTAKWIWKNDCVGKNMYLDFTDAFTVDNTDGYFLYISADNKYAAYINDTFVETSQYADYESYKVYDKIDISCLLKKGNNELFITAYYQGIDTATCRSGVHGLIFEICDNEGNVVCASGSKTLVSHNSHYANEDCVFISGQIGYSFTYDATQKNGEYSNSDIQDKSAVLFPRPIKNMLFMPHLSGRIVTQGVFKDEAAVPICEIGKRMQYSFMKYVEAFDIRTPDVLLPTLPCTDGISFKTDGICDGIFFVIDFGNETTGTVSLDIDLSEESEIIIGYSEHLDDLRCRASIGTNCYAVSYKGKKGRNVFTDRFRRIGLRYMQVHIYSKSFTVRYTGVCPTIYPLSDEPYFKCSDELHNKIYEVCKRTLQLCMHEHYEDCPMREQSQYTMDSRNQMLCGYYAFGEYEFAKASLRLAALSIRDDNMLELCQPGKVGITIPSFSAIYLLQLYEYVLYSGDKAFAEEIIPIANRIADEFIRRSENETGLVRRLKERKYWNFYEWQDGLAGVIDYETPDNELTYDAPLNAFVSIALSSLSKIYAFLEDTEHCRYYSDKANQLNKCINDTFFEADSGIYASFFIDGKAVPHFCELTQALCVYCGACTDGKLDGVLEKLSSGKLIEITPSHAIFKYEALLKASEKYGRFVFKDIARVWGNMLYNNATTFWETNGAGYDFGRAASLCHGWSATPAYFYFAYALGIKPEKCGFFYEENKPIDSGLYDCEGKIIKYDI